MPKKIDITAYFTALLFFLTVTLVILTAYSIHDSLYVFGAVISGGAVAIVILVYVKYSNNVELEPTLRQPQSELVPENQISIIEKCPLCGKIFKGQSEYCEICGKNLVESPKELDDFQSIDIIITFFKNNSTFFTILAAIAALIALIPAFINFTLGENWLSLVIGNPVAGVPSLVLLLIFSVGITFFVYYLLFLIFLDFVNFVVRNKNLAGYQKVLPTFFMIIGLVAIGASFIAIFFMWFIKLDLLIALIGIYLLYFEIAVPFVLTILVFLITLIKKSKTKCDKVLWLVLSIVLIVVVVVVSIPVAQGAFSISDNVSNYYQNKTVIVNISTELPDRISNNSPVILSLNDSIDAYFTKNLSYFDQYYAECHWTTNFGQFVEISSNSSLINVQRELIIPGCNNTGEQIYWTYDIQDYGKNKPPVIIGLIVEDPNKKTNNVIGDEHILLNWTGADTFKVENNTNVKSIF
jgi:hypothetical protein